MFGGGGPEAIDLELCEQIDEASSSRVSEHLRADSSSLGVSTESNRGQQITHLLFLKPHWLAYSR